MTEPKAKASAEPPALNIIQAINAISAEAGALGLTKEQGSGVPFAFRGINHVVNHLSPLLVKYGVVVVPDVTNILVTARDAGNRVVTQTEVVVAYTFHAPDGSSVTASAPGLAQDFADRSTAQAMSVAFRVALLQTFHLPTDDPEPEVTGQKVQDERGAAPTRAQASIAKAAAAPDPLANLRGEVRALAGKKGLSNSQINDIGTGIDPDFFSNVEALAKVKAAIEALPEQA